MPKQYRSAERPQHPFIADYAHCVDYDTHFRSDDDVRRAIAGYSGLVSALDENIGKVLAAIERAGLAGSTRVIYTSDHGDNVGARGLWGKSTFYEESAGVPVLMAGADIAPGAVVDAPVSHVDFAPTILAATGAGPLPSDASWSGASLFAVAAGARPARPVLSEYHAIGSVAGAFMLRVGRFKYCHYVAYRPQLFDLDVDPEERVDLAPEPHCAGVLAQCAAALGAVLDPQAVDAAAKRRQAALLESFGGREAALARGDLGYTPAPGARAEFD